MKNSQIISIFFGIFLVIGWFFPLVIQINFLSEFQTRTQRLETQIQNNEEGLEQAVFTKREEMSQDLQAKLDAEDFNFTIVNPSQVKPASDFQTEDRLFSDEGDVLTP